jgi:hypothetical protein
MRARSWPARCERALFEPGPSPSWLSRPERILLLLILLASAWILARLLPLWWDDLRAAIAALRAVTS